MKIVSDYGVENDLDKNAYKNPRTKIDEGEDEGRRIKEMQNERKPCPLEEIPR